MSQEVLFSSRIPLPLKQPRLNLQESEPFIPYKALLIVLSSVSHTAAMSCSAAVGLHYALNCTIFDATVASLLMPDYSTRMSISATMCLSPSCSHPPCYLQDRDEIADGVIIAPSRNHCVNISTSHHSAIRHKPTSYGRIHKRALSGRKSLELTSFCPLSRPWSRHFALSRALSNLTPR